jgi:hypothetical protein
MSRLFTKLAVVLCASALAGCGPEAENAGARLKPHLSPVSLGDLYPLPSGESPDYGSSLYVPYAWTLLLQSVGTDPVAIASVCLVGDDRGSFSVEVIITFLGYKLLYPNHFYVRHSPAATYPPRFFPRNLAGIRRCFLCPQPQMSRGNHETINMNQMYGFEGEVKAKYSAQLAEVFTEVFNWLPLAHVINKKIFVSRPQTRVRDVVVQVAFANSAHALVDVFAIRSRLCTVVCSAPTT